MRKSAIHRVSAFIGAMVLGIATGVSGPLQAEGAGMTAFFTDLNSGVPSEFSGVTTTTGVQGYAGLGTAANVFSGNFLRNTSTGNPAAATSLTLTGLPTHTSIDLNFLLAIIDSWDGASGGFHPDFFNVRVDGTPIFFQAFDHINGADQYVPPAGVQLTTRPFPQLGFTGFFPDAAYNMGLDPIFDSIPHTANTLTIMWFASGGGWVGGDDESWALDNVEVILNGVTTPVPEPGTWVLLGSGLVGMLGYGWYRRQHSV